MTRAVDALSVGTDLVLRALVIQALWLLGTVAGGIVLGWAPATMAAIDAAARAERDEPVSWRRAARIWRNTFWRSQLTIGLPGLLLALGAAVMLMSAAPLAARVPAGVGALGLLIALLHVPTLDLRYDIRAVRVLGASLLVALAQLPTSALLGAVLVLWGAVVAAVPGLLPFLGIAVPILLSQHLVTRSLQRNDHLLEQAGTACSHARTRAGLPPPALVRRPS